MKEFRIADTSSELCVGFIFSIMGIVLIGVAGLTLLESWVSHNNLYGRFYSLFGWIFPAMEGSI
jgi:hypothetical protein